MKTSVVEVLKEEKYVFCEYAFTSINKFVAIMAGRDDDDII